MAYVFLSIIVVFACTSVVYLIANDFGRETLGVLFPAIGAILLSGYLGFKSVVLDAPKPRTFGVSLAVLHDVENGHIRGMVPRGLKYITRFNSLTDFRGADLLDTLPMYNAFKGLPFSKTLQDVSDDPDSPADVLIEHFVEYAVLRWLCNPDVSVGYQPGRMRKLINSAGASGSHRGELVETSVALPENEPSPLMQALPLQIPLPKGSKVIRSAYKRISFEIVTRHSRLKVRYSGGGMEPLGTPIGEEAKRIYQGLRLSEKVKGIRLLGYDLEFTASQFPFRRFSRQAKLEAEWLRRLPDQLERDFSWPRLKVIYTED